MKTVFFVVVFLGLCLQCASAQTTRTYNEILRSDAGTIKLWDGATTRIFGITQKLSASPAIPAAVLYANEGDTLVLNARSISQGDHHTIHLHGMDVDTRNDGDPATSFWLSHMQDTTYTAICRHAGSYLYHCHVGDVVHVQMGMYGLIVVHAAGGAKTAWTGGPAFEKEYTWLTSEIDKRWHDNIPKHDSLADTIHLPPYRPNYFLINGKSKQQIAADDSTALFGYPTEKILLHIGNIGFYENLIVFPHSLGAVVVMSDGRPLPAAVRSDSLAVSPGERYEVLSSSATEVLDSVRVEYVNMNTHLAEASEYIPVRIVGEGIHSKSSEKITENVYPNPTKDFCSIARRKEDGDILSVEVVDLAGKKVPVTLEKFDERLQLDVRKLPSGRYTISVRYPRGVVVRNDIVILH